jgi:inorganic triphosphatase YgiF
MGQEVELKLEIPESVADKVVGLPWLSEVSSGPATRENLVSVYFDTAKWKLRDHGLVLRVRHADGKRVQTIKDLRKGKRGAFGRDEWEEEIAGDTPDLDLAKGTTLESLVTKKLRRKLEPIFETAVERSTFLIHYKTADLELAIDRGQIKANGRCEPLSEIEIELKRGDSAEISKLAERLAQSAPVAYGALPKPERGYALSADAAQKAVCRTQIDLDREASTGDAFQAIGLSCLDHAIANERAVRAGDAEGIHQMRVGLRRLRAAISVFKELLQDPEVKGIKTELKWLTEQLGPARDFDVLLENRVRPQSQTAPIAGEIAVLQRDLEAKRDTGLQRAKAAINSERFRKIGLQTALWLVDGEWLKNPEPLAVARRERPAIEFASEVLDQRSKKIRTKIENVEMLDARGRHKLRIAIKKLRYACEFFGGLFDRRNQSRKRERLSQSLKTMQGALGALNDIEVHKRLATSLAHPRRQAKNQAAKALAMGFIAGQEQHQIAACITVAKKAGAQLSDLSKFWK